MVISSGSTQFRTNRAVPLGGNDHPSPTDRPSADLPLLWRPTAAGLARVAEVLLERRELWSHVARSLAEGPDSLAPTRIAALSGWEAWLHVLPPRSSTGWHRHAGPVVTAVVSGRPRELRDTGSSRDALTLDDARILDDALTLDDAPTLDTTRSPDTGAAGAGRHTLVNDATEAAVTLQVYGPRTPFSARAEALLCRSARPARSAGTVRHSRHGIERDAREAS